MNEHSTIRSYNIYGMYGYPIRMSLLKNTEMNVECLLERQSGMSTI